MPKPKPTGHRSKKYGPTKLMSKEQREKAREKAKKIAEDVRRRKARKAKGG